MKNLFLILIFGVGVFPAFAVQPTIYYCELGYAFNLPAEQAYDIRHVAACLQGIVNRDAPRLFMVYQYGYPLQAGDQIWFPRLLESGGLCQGWNTQTVADLKAAVMLFRQFVNGVIVYDSDANNGVRSTMLAATTAAGVEDALAVRKDTSAGSLYNWLVNDLNGPRFPVLVDLTNKFTGTGIVWGTTVPSNGSAKCDAYVWAMENYLKTGLCNPAELSYSLDLWGLKANADITAQLNNLDFAVRNRAFCFDLSPWPDEVPCDDPGQPLGADYWMFKEILNACNTLLDQSKMIRVCGFPQWQFKYTIESGCSTKYTALELEYGYAMLVSAYNCYYDADAPQPNYISNASFYAGLEPALKGRRLVQNPAPTYNDMVSQGLINSNGTIPSGNYIYFYMGDYDSSPWTLNVGAGTFYTDANRGNVNMNWGILPIGHDRISVAIDYMYRHKTSKDFFVAPSNGIAGAVPFKQYVDRSPSNYPSVIPLWQKLCKDYYRTMDISIQGFLVDHTYQTNETHFTNYAPFSGDGIYTNETATSPRLYNNVPILKTSGYIDWAADPDTVNLINFSTGVRFAWYRTIIWSPTKLKQLQDRYASSGRNHRFLDAFTFSYLLRYHLANRQQSSNWYRATWVNDTIPRIMAVGQGYPVTVTVRNDGWDTWSEAQLYRLSHAIVAPGVEPVSADYDINGRHFLPSSVSPGDTVVFSFNITAPSVSGNYDLFYDMVRDNVTWFTQANNLSWRKSIIVANNVMDINTDGDGVPDVVEESQGTLWWHPDDNPTPPEGSIIINNGDEFTGSANVGLKLEAVGGGAMNSVAQMRFRNENLSWSAWESYKENRGWSVTSGEGLKTVSVQFRDTIGLESDVVSDTISVDLTAPTGSISIQGGRDCVTYQDVELSLPAADGGGSGVVSMRLRFAGASWPAWENYAPTRAWMLNTTPGVQTVEVQYRDAVARNSVTFSDSISMAFSPADLDCSMGVNNVDLLILTQQWLNLCNSTHRCDNADIDNSGSVSLSDFAVFARFWMNSLE